MSNEPQITVTGNIGKGGVRLNVTPTGRQVANFTVAQTPRSKRGDEWHDDPTIWFDVAVWGDPAENLVELNQGDTVIVTGGLAIDQWTDQTGDEHQKLVIRFAKVSVDLQRQNVTVRKTGRSGAGQLDQPDPWTTGPRAVPDPE